MAEPTVSVAMATYNGAAYLPAQLASLRAQRRAPDELVIVDDASTDDTVAICRRFAATAPFEVRVVARAEHRGTARTFEEAMTSARGALVLVCDQDDDWHADKVARLVEVMAARPSALLAFCDSRLIDARHRQLNRSRWRIAGFGPKQAAAVERDPFGSLMGRQIVAGCTAIVRAELIPAIFPCPTDLHPALVDPMYDRWMSLLAAAAAPVTPVPEVLIDYRIHDRQQIGIPRFPIRRVAPRLVLHGGQLVPVREEMQHRVHQMLSCIAEIEKRLRSADLWNDDVARRLDVAERHLHVRANLPEARRARLRPIVAELRSDAGYRAHSLGLATALADLLRG